jgi:serine/threonine protein kinase
MANGEDESSLPPITGPGRGKASPGAAPTIEGYQITEPLGEGGMGTVWRAVQLSTRREVALKLMTNEAFASKKARARFQREVELAARLQHTNIARIHDSGLHRGVYYYVMELVEGVPLDRYVKENRLGQKEILRLVRTVCQALQHAHQRGVIHRDLKPTNILVTADGQPHLLDFGLAKAFLEADSGASATDFGETVGTPGYMSPEQVRGEKTDSRTDIFAVGVVWYELLAGTRPFDGKMPGEILSSILTREPVSIDLLRPDVATDFRQVIHKCLRKEPDLRYQDMDDLLVDLKHLENVLESWEAVGSKKPKSVAVLLFLNLSGEPADEYLCEGSVGGHNDGSVENP